MGMRMHVRWLSLVAVLVPASVLATTFSVSNVSQLQSALGNARNGDEIVLASGTYTIGTELYMSYPGVTLRSATGNRDDVRLYGPGMNSTGYARVPLHMNAANCVVKDLTVGECYWHAIQLHDPADYCLIQNVRTANAGEQHIKGVKFVTGTVIEGCLMENTYTRINDGVARPDDYLGGIDIHGAIDVIIRDNVIRNIIGQNTDGDAGIFLWNNCSNCTTERNIVIGCNKGIAYGNPSNSSGTWHMIGGVVRNNFVYAVTSAGADIGIEMCFVKDVNVCHNTIWSDSGSFFRTFQIYASAGIPTTNLQLKYNIIRGNILSTYAYGGWTNTGNLVGNTPQANWFFDAAAGDLHLTRLATPALNAAAALADVPTDFDGQPRPAGTAPDIGADERLSGDADNDGHVNVFDIFVIAEHWNSQLGDPNYSADADVDADGSINIFDIFVIAEEWNL